MWEEGKCLGFTTQAESSQVDVQGKRTYACLGAESLMKMIRMMDVYGCSVEGTKGFQVTEKKIYQHD